MAAAASLVAGPGSLAADRGGGSSLLESRAHSVEISARLRKNSSDRTFYYESSPRSSDSQWFVGSRQSLGFRFAYDFQVFFNCTSDLVKQGSGRFNTSSCLSTNGAVNGSRYSVVRPSEEEQATRLTGNIMRGGGSQSWRVVSPDTESAWHPVSPIWEVDAEKVLTSSEAADILTPSWRMFLLSDGSVTRHLNLLTGRQITVDCVEMRHIGESLDGLPAEVALIPGPRLQRQVYLRTVEGEVLVYAASWWAAGEVRGHLKEEQESMWMNFTRQRTELYRAVKWLYLGHSFALEKSFGVKGPFWARYYLFYHKGRPLTLIYEVFSSKLEKFLGPAKQVADRNVEGL